MIKLLVPLAGTDVSGEPFSKTVGDTVELTPGSEANYIREGMAEPVKQKKAVRK